MSEVRFSEVLKADDSFRTDAEFFSKKDLIIIEQLQRLNFRKLKDVVNKIDVGFVGAMKNHYTESQNDPILLQTKNINEFTVDLDDVLHIDSDFHHELNKSQIHKGNVLIARSGSFGKASIWLEDYVVNSSDIIIVECSKEINPYYVVAFLNSEFGKTQLFRFASGGLQGHVNLTILENLIIPLLSSDFQSQIASLVKSAHTKLVESKSLYAQAEDTLLCELGLKDWQPKNEAVSIKSFSDFASSGRLDAEYYQSKYDEIEERIKSVPHKTLNEIADIQDSNFNPKAKVVYKYIELANIGTSGEITGCTEDLGENLPSRARRIVHSADVLVSSIEGSLQSCAIVSKEYDGALCSTGFYVLKAVTMNPESLLILLKSEIMQQLLKKGCSGTILTAISKDEFNHVIIPILPQETQKKIAELIQTSFALRQESKQLLEGAKLAVEQEIESAN